MKKPDLYIKLGLFVLFFGHAFAAIYSFGFHHPDEHFQILEWANYFVGNTPNGAHLPWEFAAQIRPWFQPMLHAFFIKLFMAIGIYDPFSTATFFRFGYAILNIWSLVALWNHFQKKYSLSTKWFLVFGSMWFFPYIHVRTSSENLSGFFTSFALLALAKIPVDRMKSDLKSFFYAGILFGFAFIARYQIALGLAGVAVALIIQDRGIRKTHWSMLGGFLIPVILGVFLDRWGYGNWVFTPYLYYKVNIVQHVAATFNPYPWYQYFFWVLQLLPPISILLFYGMIGFSLKRRFDFFGWFTLTFFFLHCFITNKEYRFLFPLLNFVPLMAITYFQESFQKGKNDLWLYRHGTKPVFIRSYWVISAVSFFISTFHGASMRTLWAHHAVHEFSSKYPNAEWLSNRNFLDQGKYVTPYYNLYKSSGFHPEKLHLFKSNEELSTLLPSFKESLVMIDANFDQYAVDLTRTIEGSGCKIMSNSFLGTVAKHAKIPFQVVYFCNLN